jgi:translation initiation factor 2B subunit (eIF-2B alpha/beta/delta family)
LAADHESGASTILVEVMALLREALSSGQPIVPTARALCRAQPSMAPVWNAALAACAPDGSSRLAHFAQRAQRAPAAIARFALDCFADTPQLHLVTLSYSNSVVNVIAHLAKRKGAGLHTSVRVSCSESRPALEGRRLAAQLAALEIPVTCYADAAIGHALDDADAAIVGADAIAPEWFLNKVGTRMLAAAAWQRGLPVYVVASRDKFVSAALAERLVVRGEAASEIWSEPPAGVTVRNPYFERTPLDLMTAVISDIGLLGGAVIPDVCASLQDEDTLQLLE